MLEKNWCTFSEKDIDFEVLRQGYFERQPDDDCLYRHYSESCIFSIMYYVLSQS